MFPLKLSGNPNFYWVTIATEDGTPYFVLCHNAKATWLIWEWLSKSKKIVTIHTMPIICTPSCDTHNTPQTSAFIHSDSIRSLLLMKQLFSALLSVDLIIVMMTWSCGYILSWCQTHEYTKTCNGTQVCVVACVTVLVCLNIGSIV